MNAKTILISLLLGFTLLASPPFVAQDLNWYAQADQLTGCVGGGPHAGWIEVSAIHHLWHRDEGVGTTPHRKEFILTRTMDCSTVSIWDAFRQQTNINELRLEAVDSGGAYLVRQIIRFEQVRVQSIETAAGEFPGQLVERIRFSYSRIEYESKCYDQTGQECGDHQFNHDFSQGPV